MISAEQVKIFLNINDVPNEIVESAINQAYARLQKLTADKTYTQKTLEQALLYLTCAELAPYVNAYYKRKDDAEVLNARMFAVEAEKILGLVPKGGLIKV